MKKMIERRCPKCRKAMLAYTEHQANWMLRQHMLVHEAI
jgi:hypothetical protein